MWLIDQMPAKIAAPVRVSTMNRLRAEKAMIRSIMMAPQCLVRQRRRRLVRGGRDAGERRLQARLGVDEEVRLRDDILARLDTLTDLIVRIDLGADFHFPGLEAAVSLGDEHDAAGSGGHDRAVGNREDAPKRSFKRDLRVHAGLQHLVRIRELETHLDRACLLVHDGSDECDLARPGASGQIAEAYPGSLADVNEWRFRLVDIREHPDVVEGCDLEQRVGRHDPGALDGVLRRDEAVHR